MDVVGPILWWAALVGTVAVIALVVVQWVRLRGQGESAGEAFATSVTMWLPNSLWVALVMFSVGSLVTALAGDGWWRGGRSSGSSRSSPGC